MQRTACSVERVVRIDKNHENTIFQGTNSLAEVYRFSR